LGEYTKLSLEYNDIILGYVLGPPPIYPLLGADSISEMRTVNCSVI